MIALVSETRSAVCTKNNVVIMGYVAVWCKAKQCIVTRRDMTWSRSMPF